MINKIKKIILSRLKDNKEEWVRERRMICLRCENNSINSGRFSVYRFFLTTLSTLLSFLTGRLKEEGSVGYCNICGCDNYHKTLEDSEQCSDNPPKWESLSDGSIKLDVFTERKQKAAINKNTQTNRKNYLN